MPRRTGISVSAQLIRLVRRPRAFDESSNVTMIFKALLPPTLVPASSSHALLEHHLYSDFCTKLTLAPLLTYSAKGVLEHALTIISTIITHLTSI